MSLPHHLFLNAHNSLPTTLFIMLLMTKAPETDTPSFIAYLAAVPLFDKQYYWVWERVI